MKEFIFVPQQASLPNPSDTAKQQRWAGQSYWAVATVLATSVFLTNYLPDEWGRSSGPLRAFVSVMIVIVPSISKYAHSSSFPGVAETFLSIVWAATMVAIFVAARQSYALDRRTGIPKKGRWLVFWGFVIVFLCATIVAFFIGFTVTEDNCYWRDVICPLMLSMRKSRLWMAVFGAITFGMCSMVFSVAIAIARNFRRLWLSS